jgi:hypothetical protein
VSLNGLNVLRRCVNQARYYKGPEGPIPELKQAMMDIGAKRTAELSKWFTDAT